ncbi:MAG: hypothetical protein V4568_17995 [Pseudomonadota bacterium]
MSKGKGGGTDMPKKESGKGGGSMPKMKLENAGKGSPHGGKMSGKMR